MPRSSNDKVHSQAGSHTDAPPASRAHNEKASAQQPENSVHPVEPEDPKVVGSSQTQKRVLAGNVDGQQRGRAGQPGHQAEEHPATTAGQHATGSFTDKKDQRKSA